MSKPLFIEIKGVQFRNKGAYLMLLATLQGLRDLDQPFQLVLSPGPNLPYLERAKLGAWQKLSFRRNGIDLTPWFGKFPTALRQFCKRYGLVTEADVDVVLEASGFAYGDQWPLPFLQNTAREVVRYHKAGKPFIFMPQAFGPFTTPASRQAMADIIKHATAIFVRDEISLAHLRQCQPNLPAHVQRAVDFTIGLKVAAAAQPTSRYAVLIPNHKVISKSNSAEASRLYQNYLDAFAKAADHLTQQGLAVVLVNHEGVEDAELCEKIAAIAACSIVQIEDPFALKQFIGQAELVISSRFHGAINALSQGVPCIATSWSHKYQQMMADFGVGDYCIEQLTAEVLIAKIAQLQAERAVILPEIIKNSARLAQQNSDMWQQLALVLAKTS
jgi:polysaccharide pyruvyl transferase WcaK-like protein